MSPPRPKHGILFVGHGSRDAQAIAEVHRFVEAYRDCLYDLHWPPLGDWAYLIGVAVLTLVVGAMVFAHFEPKLAEEL